MCHASTVDNEDEWVKYGLREQEIIPYAVGG